MIGLVKTARQDSEVIKHLEPNALPPPNAQDQRRTLKPMDAFGASFEGEVGFKEGLQDEILIWTQNPALTPQAGVELFEKVAAAIRAELGPGKRIANVPNFGDAADVTSTSVLWLIGEDIVHLKLDRYSSRAGIEIARQTLKSWRSSMGADESTFWVQTLDLYPSSQAPLEFPRPAEP